MILLIQHVIIYASCSKTDREDLQVIQNNALRLCLDIRLNDRISLVEIHRRSNLVSLEQRCCIQLLSLLYIHGKLYPDVLAIPPRNTRAANRKKYRTEKYENANYRDSTYYKGAKLWDTLPRNISDSDSLIEFKKLSKSFSHRLTTNILKFNSILLPSYNLYLDVYFPQLPLLYYYYNSFYY